MRRSGDRILRYAMMWREIAGDEVMAILTRRGDDQTFVLRNHACDIARTFNAANFRRIPKKRENVSAGVQFGWWLRAQRFSDLPGHTGIVQRRDDVGRQRHRVAIVWAAFHHEAAGARFEPDGIQ